MVALFLCEGSSWEILNCQDGCSSTHCIHAGVTRGFPGPSRQYLQQWEAVGGAEVSAAVVPVSGTRGRGGG